MVEWIIIVREEQSDEERPYKERADEVNLISAVKAWRANTEPA